MSDDDSSTWRLPWVGLRASRLEEALAPIAEKLGGLGFEVEEEEPGSITVVLLLPPSEEGGELEVELSFYNLGEEGVVFSLEREFGDNESIWETAWELADTIAGELGADLLEL